MQGQRSSTIRRGIVILGIVALAAAAVTPALSAFQPTKAKIKKIASKQTRKLAIEESELVRFSGTASVGTTDKPVATIGPSSFSLLLTCEDTGGGVPRILFEIRTSEGDSILEAENGDTDLDFDVGEERVVSDSTAANANDPELFEGDFFAASPSGLRVESDTNLIANYGADCAFGGWAVVISPL